MRCPIAVDTGCSGKDRSRSAPPRFCNGRPRTCIRPRAKRAFLADHSSFRASRMASSSQRASVRITRTDRMSAGYRLLREGVRSKKPPSRPSASRDFRQGGAEALPRRCLKVTQIRPFDREGEALACPAPAKKRKDAPWLVLRRTRTKRLSAKRSMRSSTGVTMLRLSATGQTDYIQHSAHIAPGRDGLFKLVRAFARNAAVREPAHSCRRRLRHRARPFLRHGAGDGLDRRRCRPLRRR